MENIYVDQDHHSNKLLNVDLTSNPLGLFPPGLGGGSGGSVFLAGDGIVFTDNGDGTITISAAPPVNLKVEGYRERFTVGDATAQTPLQVVHNLNSTGVSVTVVEVGSPSRPVNTQVSIVDMNTVEVLLTGESNVTFDILVVAGVDPSNPH